MNSHDMLTADKWAGQPKHALQDLLPSNHEIKLMKMAITNVKISLCHIQLYSCAVLRENSLQQNVMLP